MKHAQTDPDESEPANRWPKYLKNRTKYASANSSDKFYLFHIHFRHLCFFLMNIFYLNLKIKLISLLILRPYANLILILILIHVTNLPQEPFIPFYNFSIL